MSKDDPGRNRTTESALNETFEQLLSRAVSGQALDIIVLEGYQDWALRYARQNRGVLEDIYEKHDIPPAPIMELVQIYVRPPGGDSSQFGKKSKDIKRLDIKLRGHWEKVKEDLDAVEQLNKKQGLPLELPSRTISEIDNFIRDWLTLYDFKVISECVWNLAEFFRERTGKTLNRYIAELTVAAFPAWLPKKPEKGAYYWERVENSVSHILGRRQNRNT